MTGHSEVGNGAFLGRGRAEQEGQDRGGSGLRGEVGGMSGPQQCRLYPDPHSWLCILTRLLRFVPYPSSHVGVVSKASSASAFLHFLAQTVA